MKTNPKLKQQILQSLKDYRKKYISKKFENLDESGTRIMINDFLVSVLGYLQLEDIKTEYAIKGTYADYVIQVAKKKYFVVEVKAFQIDLSENHLRQAVNYAANEGIPWVLLTNGRQFELHAVIFAKPISEKLVFSFNLLDPNSPKQSTDFFYLIHKKNLITKELEKFWSKFQSLESQSIAKYFYSEEIVRIIKKKLKEKTGISFETEDIVDAIHKVVVLPIEISKPKSMKPITKRENKIIETQENVQV